MLATVARAVLAALALLVAPGAALRAQTSAVRGVWIPNTDTAFFDSRENIAAGCAALAEAGINVVFPVAWSKGHTLYRSDVVGALTGAEVDPRYAGRDPLAETILEAHRHGMEVVPWFEYGFAAGHERFHGRVLDAKPGWAALGADGKPVVKNGFEWMNALDPEVQAFLTAMVLEVCERYDVDGVQGDDRLPALAAEGGYNPGVAAEYAAETGKPPPADHNDPAWTKWRADRLTAYLARLRAAVKAVDDDLVLTMAPGAPSWAYRDYLQDQRTWVERGLVDSLHPQAYARSLDGYAKMVDQVLDIAWIAKRRDLLAPGVLTSLAGWYADKDLVLGAVAAGRERRLAGEVYFFHEGLIGERSAVGRALAAGPYARPARLPWRKRDGWRPPAIAAERASDAGARWTATAKAAGHYGVYARLAPGASETIGFGAAARGGDAGALAVDASAPAGWTRLGTLKLSAGGGAFVEGAADASRVAEVLLMVDRLAERR